MTTTTAHRFIAVSPIPKTASRASEYTHALIGSLAGNALIPNPNPSIATLTDKAAKLDTAQTATKTRAHGSVATRDAALDDLVLLLHAFKANVQLQADANPALAEALIASLGWAVRKTGPRVLRLGVERRWRKDLDRGSFDAVVEDHDHRPSRRDDLPVSIPVRHEGRNERLEPGDHLRRAVSSARWDELGRSCRSGDTTAPFRERGSSSLGIDCASWRSRSPTLAIDCAGWFSRSPTLAIDCASWRSRFPTRAIDCASWFSRSPTRAIDCASWFSRSPRAGGGT